MTESCSEAYWSDRGATSKEEGKTDTEFHIRCSDRYAHRHHTDPRYNNVILHVVLIFDSAGPVLRQDGRAVAVCSLNGLVPAIFPQPQWPCQCIIPSMDAQTRAALYRQLGLERDPGNACQQQGLHYIDAHTCREKQCADCMIVGRDM